MLSEIIQTEKDKYCMISFICGIQKKIQLNTYIYQNRNRLRDIENKVVVTSGKRDGGGAN